VVLDHDPATPPLERRTVELGAEQPAWLLRRGRPRDQHGGSAQDEEPLVLLVADDAVPQVVAGGVLMQSPAVEVCCPDHPYRAFGRVSGELRAVAVPHERPCAHDPAVVGEAGGHRSCGVDQGRVGRVAGQEPGQVWPVRDAAQAHRLPMCPVGADDDALARHRPVGSCVGSERRDQCLLQHAGGEVGPPGALVRGESHPSVRRVHEHHASLRRPQQPIPGGQHRRQGPSALRWHTRPQRQQLRREQDVAEPHRRLVQIAPGDDGADRAERQLCLHGSELGEPGPQRGQQKCTGAAGRVQDQATSVATKGGKGLLPHGLGEHGGRVVPTRLGTGLGIEGAHVGSAERLGGGLEQVTVAGDPGQGRRVERGWRIDAVPDRHGFRIDAVRGNPACPPSRHGGKDGQRGGWQLDRSGGGEHDSLCPVHPRSKLATHRHHVPPVGASRLHQCRGGGQDYRRSARQGALPYGCSSQSGSCSQEHP
jgi:hypothetical protein